ncbi:MAG: hypothetical protein AB1767_11630 [Bacillota bacterium]
MITVERRGAVDPAGCRVRRLPLPVAVLLVAALIVTGWVALAGLSLQQTLLNTAFYRAVAQESALPVYLRERLLGALMQPGEGDEPLLAADMSVIGAALEKTISAAWLETEFDAAIEAAVAFIGGRQANLLLAVDLLERKAVFKTALQEELHRVAPPALARLELTEAQVEQFIDQLGLPDRLVLVDTAAADLDGTVAGALRSLRATLLYLRFVPWVFWAVLALLCLAGFGPAGGCKLLGGALIAAGLTFPAPLFAARGPALKLLSNLFGFGEALSRAGAPDLFGTAYDCARETALRISLIYAGIGPALLLAALLVQAIKRRRGFSQST